MSLNRFRNRVGLGSQSDDFMVWLLALTALAGPVRMVEPAKASAFDGPAVDLLGLLLKAKSVEPSIVLEDGSAGGLSDLSDELAVYAMGRFTSASEPIESQLYLSGHAYTLTASPSSLRVELCVLQGRA